MKEFIKSNYLLFIKIILTICTLYSLKYLYRLKNIESEFYTNITFIFIIVAVYLLINYTVQTLKNGINKRLCIISLIMGLYFAFAAVLGAYYEGVAKGVRYAEVLDFTFNHFIVSLKYIPALWFLFLGCILFIYIQIPKIYGNYISQNSLYTEMPKIFNNLYKIWLFIFICWLPYFILLYPGYVNPDANWQISQLFAGKFNTHHPLLTTFYMYFIPFYYKLSNNGILTIALYVIFFQMLPLSFVYAYIINKLNNIYVINKNVIIFLILFVALYPANPIVSIIIEKRVLFIIFILLFFMKLIEILENKELLKSKKNIIQLIILGIVLSLTRNNVIYALFFTLPIMLFFAKKYSKYILLSFAGIFIGYIILNTAMIKLTNASKGQFRESMSMPMQQIARVYKYNKNTLDENDIKFIEKMMNKKDTLNSYHPKLSDHIKGGANSSFFKTKEFIAGYINLGLKYPETYLNSFLIMSSPIWDSFSNQFFRMCLIVGQVKNRAMNITQEDLKKHQNQLLSNYLFKTQRYVKENNSMASFILFNQSFLFYFFIFTFIYFIYKRMFKYNFILLIPLVYTATLFLAPIIYFRYTYFLVAVFPMVIMMLTNNNNNNEITLNDSENNAA